MDSRGLYLAVAELVAREADSTRSLPEFLRALRAALDPMYGEQAITAAQFVEALRAAFTGPVPAPVPAWRDEDLSEPAEGPADAVAGAAAVDRLLKSPVLNLEDAEASGAAQDEYRGFGVSVGRAEGVRRATSDHYYNWSPASYLECAVAGAFGGWEPGDDTDRRLVPGDVAVLTDDGIVAVPAAEVASPVVEVDALTWAQVLDFLWCGQHYE